MPEEDTISTALPPDKVISSPLSGADQADFEQHANKIWEDLDREAASAPPTAAPVEKEKAQEVEQEPAAPVAEPPKSKRKLSEQTSAPSEAELNAALDGEPAAPQDEPKARMTAEELDSIDLHPRAPESQKSQFKQLKEIAKTSITEAKAFRSKLAPLAQELGIEFAEDNVEAALDQFAQKVREAKSGVDPKLVEEVQWYRSRDALKGITDSYTFQRQYRAPLDQKYDEVLDKIFRHLPGDVATNKANWLDPLMANYRPGSKNAEGQDEKWWAEQVNAMSGDNITKQGIMNDIIQLRELQDRWTQGAAELARNPVTLEKLKEADTQQYISDYDTAVRSVTKEVLDKDQSYSEYRELRDKVESGKADEAEQKEWQKIANEFTQVLSDVNSGPRAASKVAMECLRLRREVAELDKLRKEVKDLRREVRTKRGIIDSPLRPSSGRGAGVAPAKTNGTQRLSDTRKPDFSSL